MQNITITPIKEEKRINLLITSHDEDGSSSGFVTNITEEEAQKLVKDLEKAISDISETKVKEYKYNRKSNRLEPKE